MTLADQRAIDLYCQLRKIEEEMPLLGVRIRNKQIIIFEKNNDSMCEKVSVKKVLSFNLKSAQQAGGTLPALFASAYGTNLSVPRETVDEAVHDLLTDN